MRTKTKDQKCQTCGQITDGPYYVTDSGSEDCGQCFFTALRQEQKGSFPFDTSLEDARVARKAKQGAA